MTNAKRDGNMVPTEIVASNADGFSPVLLRVDPTTRALQVEDGTTGSAFSDTEAARDGNMVTMMIGVSSDDGVTPTQPYGNPSNGKLLVNYN